MFHKCVDFAKILRGNTELQSCHKIALLLWTQQICQSLLISTLSSLVSGWIKLSVYLSQTLLTLEYCILHIIIKLSYLFLGWNVNDKEGFTENNILNNYNCNSKYLYTHS